MSAPLINIVYTGEITTADQSRAIVAFARRFGLDIERADAILASPGAVLKSGLTRDQALRYQQVLSDIGVVVRLQSPLEPEALITLEPEEPEEQQEPEAEVEIEPDIARNGEFAVPPLAVDYDLLTVEEPEQQPASPIFAAIQDGVEARRLSFQFTGNGAAFFRIWIVDLALTVLTLGVYSAWASVRTRQYFYSHTLLDGVAFEYLPDPRGILCGRAIALVSVLVGYPIIQFAPDLTAAWVLYGLLLLPCLVAVGRRHRLRHSAYRGVRFDFDGTPWGALQAYSPMVLLVPLSLGLLLPALLFLHARYRVDNSRFGIDQFSLNVSLRHYYRIFFRAILAIVVTIVTCFLLASSLTPLVIVVLLVGIAALLAYVKVHTTNLVFDCTQLGDHRFSASLALLPYFLLIGRNILLTAVTLGLYYPWAKVSAARYCAEHTMMIACGRLDVYVTSAKQDARAAAAVSG